MTTLGRMAGLLLAVAFLGGCSTRVGDLTVASTKNIPTDFQMVQSGLQGKDCSYAFLGLIPLGTMNPTLDGALDDALAKVPTADALANATVTTDAYYFILWAQSCVRVTGDAISTR